MPRRRRSAAAQVFLAALLCMASWPRPWHWRRSSTAQSADESPCFAFCSGPQRHGAEALARGVHRSARGGAEGGKETVSAATATAEEDESVVLARQAARLREEAAAQQALLESQKRLREEKAKLEAPPEEEDAKELERVLEKLLLVRPKLRKAEAFSLPELGELRKEVDGLESRSAALKAKLQPPAAPAPAPASAEAPSSSSSSGGSNKKLGGMTRNGKKMSEWTKEDWEALATMFETADLEKRFDIGRSLGPEGRKRVADILIVRDEARQKEEEKKYEDRMKVVREEAKKLRSKITFEKLQAMSNEERLELAQEVGPAYLTSLAIVAICFWAVGLPVLTYAYYDATGKYPDIFSVFTLDSLTAAGGLLASVLAAYALLKPARLLAALLLTPWTVENVMPNLPWAGLEEEEEGQKSEGKDDKSGGESKK